LSEERFFRFGLGLQLEEVDRPKDLESWTDKPFTTDSGKPKGFVEENLETVLSVNLGTLLPDEDWLLIGRQEAAVGNPDLTAISKACDLVLLEIKKGKAKPEMVEQGLDYLIRAPGLGYSYYLERYLDLQCHRDYREAIRLLGLLKGARLDLSGPVRRKNWERLEKENDTSIPNEQFLSLAGDLLHRIDYPAFDVSPHPERALADKFRTHFGFDGAHLLEGRFGQSVNLAFVAEDFSHEVLEKVQTHYRRNTFFYVLRAKLYRHRSDTESFLLSFTHLVPDGAMSKKDPKPFTRAFEIWRFLGLLKEEIVGLEALNRQGGRDLCRIPLYRWTWCFSKYNNLRFFPREAGHHGQIRLGSHNQSVEWVLDWMNRGTRPNTLQKIRSKISERGGLLPQGTRATKGGALIKGFEIRRGLNRALARDLAKDIYDFLTYTFEFYDSCGLWDDPFDYYRKANLIRS